MLTRKILISALAHLHIYLRIVILLLLYICICYIMQNKVPSVVQVRRAKTDLQCNIFFLNMSFFLTIGCKWRTNDRRSIINQYSFIFSSDNPRSYAPSKIVRDHSNNKTFLISLFFLSLLLISSTPHLHLFQSNQIFLSLRAEF